MDFAVRPATLADLDAISEIRLAVQENVLSDPAAITRADYVTMLAPERGACWVAESHGEILGFSWADFAARNVWALFVRPERERRGVGRAVHATMMDAFFSRSDSRVWLGT
ncbi:MAG TPA: GNAT family N-acetyltransferase, partial [Tahibacter sp.]|nr:GNAT family N-acetyltransferase [Tahibacter sp.]